MTSMLGAYDRLLSSRASSIGTVESALRTLSWILPGTPASLLSSAAVLCVVLTWLGYPAHTSQADSKMPTSPLKHVRLLLCSPVLPHNKLTQ